MGKPKKHKKKPPGGRSLAAIITDLRAVVDTMRREGEAGPLWGQTQKLLMESPAENASAMALIARRDVDAVAAFVDVLEAGGTTPDEAPAPAEELPEVDPEEMKKALRAFRKRLKFMRLDEESKLGVGPMTGGKKSEIKAIIPPMEFSREVWDALVRSGQMLDRKQGFYELTEE